MKTIWPLLLFFFAVPVSAQAADAPTGCIYVELATMPIKLTGPNFQPMIAGSINGQPARMLVDTGAQSSLLTRRAVDSLHLDLRLLPGGVNGVGGVSDLYETPVDDIAVGKSHSGPTKMRVIGDMAHQPAFDAIVGAPFLLQADMEFNLSERHLKLFRPKNCEDRFLAYWKEGDVNVVPFQRRYEHGPNPILTVMLNGMKIDAIIDTGADVSTITLNAAKKAGFTPDAPGVVKMPSSSGVGRRTVPQWNGHFDTFVLGSETIRDIRLAVADTTLPDFDMLLGRDFLRAHRVLFAMSQRKLYLTYLGGEPFAPQTNKVEPWLLREAEDGNPDAQFRVASTYAVGTHDAALSSQRNVFLEKAAAQGHPDALRMSGRFLLHARKFPEAATRLRAAQDLDSRADTALYLYLARIGSGQAALAREELMAAGRAHQEWPAPLPTYYLGLSDAATLLAAVGKNKTCAALAAMLDLEAVQGVPGPGEAARPAHAECDFDKRTVVMPAMQTAAAVK